MAKPSVSIMNSIFSACGMWKSGSSTARRPYPKRGGRYGHRRSMYRFLFSPRWLGFHLLVIVGIVTMVNLGFWQLRRLDERKAFNAQVSERIADPPAPLDDVLTAGTDPDSVEWRSVTAPRDVPARRAVRRRQPLAGRHRRHDGRHADAARRRPAAAGRAGLRARHDDRRRPAPTGTVDVVGRLRPSEERRTGQLSDPQGGRAAGGAAGRHRPPDAPAARRRRCRCTSS